MSFAEWIAKFGKIKLGKFQLIVVNSFVVVLFFLVLPYLMYLLKGLDNSLGFGEFNSDFPGFVVEIIFTLVDMSFALWTVSSQLFIGKGNPIPLLPTQKLIIKGLYRYSRNPLVFGGFLFCMW
jgi:protein-S-isoprenylcysteine O-methyltransferase Ste14